MVLRGLVRGAAAGAAGATALDVVSGVDAAVRARQPSDAPEQLVGRLADAAGVEVPGRRKERARRIAALGPLAGAATGIGLGSLAGALRAVGLRVPTAIGGPLLGAAAMAASDVPLATTGISDPRSWSRQDWMADVLPHLAYGVVAHRTLEGLDRHEPVVLPSAGTLLRAVALGVASGARSFTGAAAIALTARSGDGPVSNLLANGAARTAAVVLGAGEMVADKLPAAPSRLAPPALVPRVAFGGATAAAAASRAGADPDLPALVGAVSAAAWSVAGVRLRALAQERFGSDLPGALTEDVLAGALAWWGSRR